MSDLSKRIDNLSQEQRELLRRLLRDKSPKPVDGPATASLTRAPRESSTVALPTSFAQQRLWFLDRLEPGSASYNIFDSILFTGALDVRALRESVNEIVRRHESLRTTFREVDGAPMQLIAASLDIELPVVNLGSLDLAEREEETARLMAEESERAFDLSQGPLLRTTLLRFNGEEHLLLLNMHHIISDAWSLEVFNRELRALYEAFRMGNGSPLPELPLQYADFAVWQRQWLRGEVLARQLTYWKDRLAGAPTVLELPADHPRRPVQGYKGARQTITLRTALVESLRALGHREGVTLFMTMLAAFNVLLFRYTGQEDVVVGTPIANRARSELEDLIGFFINTLVLRSDLSGDPSFRGLLARVKEVALGAYAHQDLPFEMLVLELHPERDMSRNPLFQVAFQLTNAPNAGGDPLEEDVVGADSSPSAGESAPEVEVVASKFDLLFNVWDHGGGLEVQADYSTDLFNDTTITRMLEHYRVVLNGVVADADQHLSLMPLLTSEEERLTLVDWNNTEASYPRDACLHELFESMVDRYPQSIAVSFGREQLTYCELNERSNQEAWRLRALRVGPEVRVGLCTDRSLETVVGMLAILKAGGVYVPLDPEYPAERLAFMLEDAEVPVLLTQQHLLPALPEFHGEVLCLNADLDDTDKTNVKAGTTADNLAYVIYTSGSTGRPKGVAVPHRAVTRLVCNTNYIDLKANDRVAQASNTTFDAATFEVWGTLLHGAQLIGIGKEAVLSPQLLAAQVRELAISVMFLPTSLFNHVVGEISDAFHSVHTLMFGGEEANVKRTRELLQAGRPQRLLNVYGPTEGTTFSTWHMINNVPEDALRIPIGRPIGNVRTYVLDQYQQPVPAGVTGELYIGGEGLARGYVGAPELTAERFVPDALGGSAGARLYRTGDMVRYLANGELEFLGRRDGQVKVRGFRVEVGEVEAALRAEEGVRDAVVVGRKDQSGHLGLVAYVVAVTGDGTRVSVGELRSQLKARLPDYMVPAAFVLLDDLPLNSNGKLDRKALPSPNVHHHDDAAKGDDAPRTAAERTIAAVWREVLGVEPFSVHANFFDLGGHSLVLVRVNTKLRDLFRREIPIINMFKYPTVSSLAASLDQSSNNEDNYQQIHDRAAKQREALNHRRQVPSE
jgi:amino acid adenylation domain-containing protein